MQQDNNIENKLRQLEAMEQPDLSQMDNHWQQMQAMLQPGALPMKKGWPKWMLNTLSISAVVILIGAAMWYVSSKKDNSNENAKNEKNKPVVKQNDDASKESIITNAIVPVVTDDAIRETITPSTKLKINPSLIYNNIADTAAKKWTAQDSILATVKLNYTPCETCPGKEVNVLTDAQRRLGNLFAQLEKQEQHFVIDNSRDTLLQFKEGTVLLIPANSFGGMNGIELSAKEFYKTSDIVLNQLNTASNKEQLETGGMLHLQASYKGTQLNIDKQKPLLLFMPDTSALMQGMQLFLKEQNKNVGKETGELMDTGMNGNETWLPNGQYFMRKRLQTEVKVLNLVNEPYVVKEKSKGQVAYFMVGEESAVERSKLRQMLKEKYGYYKIKFRADFRNHFGLGIKLPTIFGGKNETDSKFNYTSYNRNIGDSVWMDKATADRYKLVGTATRQITLNNFGDDFLKQKQYTLVSNGSVKFTKNYEGTGPNTSYSSYCFQTEEAFKSIEEKYSVNLSQLGWINCDRFYADSRKKIQYKVDLGDSATNYYTMLVFDNLNSMMTGFISGNEVSFQNIPVGEPVKVISIGINKKGETVYSVTHTTTSEEELKGLQFLSTSAPDLRTALSKYDK
jgi:hypothetical protein